MQQIKYRDNLHRGAAAVVQNEVHQNSRPEDVISSMKHGDGQTQYADNKYEGIIIPSKLL